MERLEKLEEEQQRELAELEDEKKRRFFLWKELFFLECAVFCFLYVFFWGVEFKFLN